MSTQGKHTPGPWRIVNRRSIMAGYRMITTAHEDSALLAEDDANARLIAAAPELLAALQMCVHLVEREADRLQSTEFTAGANNRLSIARAAIAKATGEQS